VRVSRLFASVYPIPACGMMKLCSTVSLYQNFPFSDPDGQELLVWHLYGFIIGFTNPTQNQ
jgi:hypothetical protein